MGREIDERVVQMKFEAGQFERGISTSTRSLEEYKKALNFDDSIKGFEKLDRSAKALKLDGLSAGVEAVRVKFDLLQITAFNVLNRISNKAIDTGERLVKGLSIEQISVGWDKFASKTTSVQTIMAATASQFSDTGAQMEVVNEQLDKLNWFTDETSYNFVDMVNNIGKFTSNNIDLKTSVTAMQGIANWAAISGANANEASRAMYNISQALSTGAVKLIDWKSIENANMATAEFKKTVIEMAAETGTLRKITDDTFTTLDGKVEISTKTFNGFNDSLQKGWFSTEVLMKSLDRYGGATNKLNKYYEETGLLTSEIVSGVDDYTNGTKTAAQVSNEWGISLERTQAILEDFNNEQDQFGLKAFKAAQEAKTFEDAINSVKDAVSTGWMKSFEYIFGDYLEAKEFFTDLANTLYDIFAAGGEQRNQNLKLWKEWGGREMLIDSIWNALSLVLSILEPIKAAWVDIFGEATAERMFKWTERLQKFMETLAAMTEGNMPKLQRSFRGLFAILDMIRMLLGGGFKIAVSLIRELFGDVNLDVFEFTGSIGDSIVALRNWMREGGRFDNVINEIIRLLKVAINQARSFINSIKQFGPIKTVLDGFRSVFTKDFHGIDSVIEFTKSLLSSLWNLISAVPKMTSLQDIKFAFDEFGLSVIENLKSIGISFEGLEELGKRIFGSLNELLKDVSGGFGDASVSAGNALSVMQKQLNKVDWAGVTLLATGIAMLALAWKIADSIAIIAKSFGKATDVMKSVKGMTDAIGGYFKALKENMKSNNILKMAIAIGILSAAFYTLAKLDTPALITASVAIFAISGALALLLTVVNKRKASESNGGAWKVAAIVLSFSAAVALIAKAIGDIEMEGIVPKLVVVGGIMAALILLTKYLSKGTAIEKSIPSLASFIGMVIALNTFLGILKKMAKMPISEMFAALPILFGVSVIMAAFIRLSSKSYIIGKEQKVKTIGSIGSALAIALALNFMVSALKKLGKIDPEVLVKGLIGMGAVFAEFSALMIAARVAGQYANSAGKMLLCISLALNLLAPALKRLGSITPNVAAQGLSVMLKVSAILSAMMVLSKFSGQHAAKAGLMFVAVAGAMMALQLVIKTLGKVDSAELLKGVLSVSAVILSLGVTMAAIKGQFNVETTKTMVKLTIIIGILAAAVLAMSFIKPERAIVAALGLSAVLLSLSASLRLINDVKLPDIKSLSKLYLTVAAMGAILAAVSYFTDPKSVLATATGLSEVLLALSVSAIILGRAKAPTEKQAKSWAIFVDGVGGVMAGLVAIIAIVNKVGSSIDGILTVTTGMSEILLSLAVAGRIMDKQKNPSVYNTRAMNQWIISVGILIGSLAIIQAAINSSGGSTKGLLSLTTAISEILIALGITSRIMGKQGGDFKMGAGSIAAVGAMLIVIGGILSTFSNFTDPARVIPLATAMGGFMLALSGALKIISTIQGDIFGVNIGMFAILSVIAGLLGSVIAGLSNIVNPERVIPITLGLSAVLLALSGVVWVLSNTFPSQLTGAWSSLGMLGTIVLALGGLTLTLGALMQMPGFKAVLADGGEGMKLFGQAIGNFLGGIVGGFVGGAVSFIPTLGTYLSEFMMNAKAFFDGINNMPDGIAGKMGDIALGLIALTGAELLNALGNFASSIFGGGDKDLGAKFKSFGEALSAFSDGLGDNFDSAKVESAANAGKALADLETSLPRKDGKLQEWIGEKDLGAFGYRLMLFGLALRGFAVSVDGINVDAVEAAANAGSLLAGLENNIAPQGGKLQSWLGEKRIDDFGTRIVEFGTAISDFSNVVAGNINSEAVESAVNAGKLLATLEENIPPQDGMLQQFLGSKSVDDFGSRLTKFGLGLFWFSFYAAGINAEAIKSATDATAALVEMEKNVDQSGGWGELFTGKSDFSSFGKHLEDLGSALKSYNTSISAIMLEKIDAVTLSLTGIIDIAKSPTTYFDNLITLGNSIKEYAPSIGVWSSNASSADTDKMSAVTLEIEKLLKLSELTSASQWISDIIGHANAMVVQLTMALALKQASLMQAGKNVAYWLIRGVKIGMDDYSDQAVVAAVGLAKIIQTTVEDTLGIASPSTVMIEEGHWIVKGIAEGITSDMSAEEAAKKKADNIVAAFQAGFETLTSLANNRQLKYDVWSVSDGLNASEAEKQARELELKRGNLEDAAERAKAQSAAFEAAKQSFAEGSKQYIDAENNMLTAMKEMYEIRNEIDKLQGTLMASGGDSYTRNNAAYIDYINSNKEAYEMLGWDQNKLIEDAKRKTGFGMVDITPAGKIDTQVIVDSALSEQTVSIVQEKVKKRVGKTVSSGVVSGIEAGVAEATNAMRESGTSSGGKSASDAIETAFNGLARVGRQTSGEWLEMGDGAATNVAAGFVNGLSSKVSDVYKASYGMGDTSIGGINAGTESASPSKAAYRTGTYVGQGLINGMASMVKPSKEEGYFLGVNTMEGLKLGIDAKGQEAIAAAIAVANAVKAAMRGALGIRSPSRITRSFGNYLDDGLAIGLRDRISIVENAGEEVANATLRAMQHANSLINDVIESDDAFHPTITPVLNLDDLKNQKGLIGKTFGGHQLDLSATRLQVGSIADQTAYRQNEINVPGVSTNYNFVQNNYSPKALNQAEIYRQTKNEFSRLKGASQR